jgi:hypothetical protein
LASVFGFPETRNQKPESTDQKPETTAMTHRPWVIPACHAFQHVPTLRFIS